MNLTSIFASLIPGDMENIATKEEKTYFASATRPTSEGIHEESEVVGSQKFFHEIFGTFTGTAAVIDKM